MNRRLFINRLFLFTGALSSGLWVPQPAWSMISNVCEGKCVRRIYSQAYLETLYNDGKPLDLDEIFKLFYALKKARDKAGYDGQIVIIPREETSRLNIVESELFGHVLV